MANRRDIAGLLTGIPSGGIDPRVGMTPQQMRANAVMGGIEQMGRGVRGMFGGDRRTGQERQQDAVLGKMQADKAKEQSRMTAFSTFLENKYPDSGLDKLAAQGIVTPENLNDFLKDKQDANAQKGTTFTVQDTNGDNFTATSVFNPNTGKTDVSYSPIGATKSQQPVGKVQITGGEFGLTAVEDREREIGLKGKTKKEQEYQKRRTETIDMLPTLNASRDNLERATKLLETVETGGPINIAATGLENFLGVKSANKAELQIILGQEMYKSLKPLFGGVISDPERQAIEAIYAGLEKGNIANAGILKKLKQELDDNMIKAALYLNSETAEDFDTVLKQMFPVATEEKEQENIIDFGDLDNVSNPKR